MTNLTRWTPSAPAPGGPRPDDDNVARTLSYSRDVVFCDWDDLPGGPPLPAGTVWSIADDSTVRRGEDYRQRVQAWTLTHDALHHVTAERPLRRRDDGKLAPAGKWTSTREALPVANLVRLKPAGEGTGNAGPVRVEKANKTIEALPAPVQRLLLAANHDPVIRAIQHTRGGRTWEDLRALAVGNQVIAVRARRDEGQLGWSIAVWRADRTGPGIAPGQQRAVAPVHSAGAVSRVEGK